MRLVAQRALSARVTVEGETVGEIALGWLALVGVEAGDTLATADRMAERLAHLRAFADDDGKMSRSALDVGGAVLVVSNFTLAADCKSRRPSFTRAARPEAAEPLVEAFRARLAALGIPTAAGRFGADMRVELVNDGPVTLVLDSAEKSADTCRSSAGP